MNIDEIKKPPKILEIPVEYKDDFLNVTSARRSLRDVCSYPGLEITSSIPLEYLKRSMKSIYVNPFNIISGNIDHMPCTHTQELYGAFDLGKKSDPLAFCFCHVDHYFQHHDKLIPFVIVDVIGRLDPRQIKDFKLSKVKDIIESIYKVGHDIRLITFDQWQSYRVMEEVEDEFPGIVVAECSIDTPSHFVKIDLEQPKRYSKISTGKNYLAPFEIISTALEQDGIGCPEFHFLIRDTECLQVAPDGKKVIKVAQSDGYNHDDTAQVFISSVWHCILNSDPDEIDLQNREKIPTKVKRSSGDSFDDFLDSINTDSVPQNVRGAMLDFDEEEKDEIELDSDPFNDSIGGDYYW